MGALVTLISHPGKWRPRKGILFSQSAPTSKYQSSTTNLKIWLQSLLLSPQSKFKFIRNILPYILDTQNQFFRRFPFLKRNFFCGEKKRQSQYAITGMRTTVETWWNIVNFAMFYSYKDFKTKIGFHFKPPNSTGSPVCIIIHCIWKIIYTVKGENGLKQKVIKCLKIIQGSILLKRFQKVTWM